MEDGTREYSAPDMETERQVCRKSFWQMHSSLQDKQKR